MRSYTVHRCQHRGDAPEIGGFVMVDEFIPAGEFADISIGDWRESLPEV